MSHCYYGCGRSAGLRPYGPGGEPICFPCMKANPQREQAAAANYLALVEAAAAASPVGVAELDTPTGPKPFVPSENPDA